MKTGEGKTVERVWEKSREGGKKGRNKRQKRGRKPEKGGEITHIYTKTDRFYCREGVGTIPRCTQELLLDLNAQ